MNEITVKFLPRSYSYTGPQLIASEHVREQFRFPRTKKRRIRNKWAKRPENFRPARGAWHDTERGVIYMHPATLERYQKQRADTLSTEHERTIRAHLFGTPL